MRSSLAIIFTLVIAGCTPLGVHRGVSFEQEDVFVGGQEGYHTFRIPALIVTRAGTLLAFCEGRRNSGSDTGDIDTLVKRRTNGGEWEATQVIADDGPNTIGNPCPVVDAATGTIWLLLTHNSGHDAELEISARKSRDSRSVWVSRSTDDGVTWSEPVEITATTKLPDWTWYATGPGCGIQLASGRMVIPCDHNLAGSNVRRSHVIYSDDHGASWQVGGVIGDGLNECQVVELVNGALMLNMRNYATGEGQRNRRAVSLSHDQGQTWSHPWYDPALIEPVCQASFIRFTARPTFSKNRLLFANPASTKREKMTVRMSYDEGMSWPVAREINTGPSAYSALAVLPDMRIACFYERGEKNAYQRLTLAVFSLEWLTQGADRL